MGTDSPDVSTEARQHCHQHGCTRTPVAGCHYVDEDGRLCVTAWCAEHRAPGIVPYCRRHARIVAARESGKMRGPLPSLGNRAPSLVAFVTEAVEVPLTLLLNRLASERGESLSSTPIELAQDLPLRWQQSWSLRSSVHESLLLSISVDEPDDPEMRVTINDRELRFIPPWIMRRQDGTELPAREDDAERRRFYAELVERIRSEIERQIV